MKNSIVGFVLCLGMVLSSISNSFAQQIPDPEEVLGFEFGSQFARHHQVVDYFKSVEAASPLVKIQQYGQTPEGRPLMAAIVSSEANHQRLEEIRQNNLKRAGLLAGNVKGEQVAVVWMSYNVHGDEAVCSDAAVGFLHELLVKDSYRRWLDSLVVIIDPCLNPDGRDKYVNWYRNISIMQPSADPNSWEHQQPWPGGRLNHYCFDLNRDWAWQTQPESQQRVAFYQQWMPHVHTDFHEMGYNSPYFFAPAAEPYHPQITAWQRQFQQLMGANHAKYFDEKGWLYYTGEVFDLFYPSYGDTWPIFNGAQGFTYEQGGSSRAGRAIHRERGDTLLLSQRLLHHLTTSISTIELAFLQREELLCAYNQYFQDAAQRAPGTYKSYVIKYQNKSASVKSLYQLLDRQQIIYSFANQGQGGKHTGFSYLENKESASFAVEKGDLVISAYQPQARLIQVMFEPHTVLSDSLTYDLTAWALPYAYQLEAYACKDRIELTQTAQAPDFQENKTPDTVPYAILSNWEDANDLRFLATLLKQGIQVRYAKEPITIGNQLFERGTLMISREENQEGYEKRVISIANQAACELSYISSGMLQERNIISDFQLLSSSPQVAILGGPEVRPTSFGEVWHFFEQELQYPVSILHTASLSKIPLTAYDVVVLPSGTYHAYQEKLLRFVKRGGKLIVMEKAITAFSVLNQGKEGSVRTQLAVAIAQAEKAALEREKRLEMERKLSRLGRYEDMERSYLSNTIAGSIYRVDLDVSHPLSFGIGEQAFLIKRNREVYPFLAKSTQNIGKFTVDSHIMGFAGVNIKQKVENSLAIGEEKLGSGKIIYMTDAPIFRAFWHSGKLLFGNAIFF
jgi:hypothetical protein